jgi:plasmid stability protein
VEARSVAAGGPVAGPARLERTGPAARTATVGIERDAGHSYIVGSTNSELEARMPDLTIRGIPQDEMDALATRAARHGRTEEEEARHLIHEAAAEEMLLTQLEEATKAVEARLRSVDPAAGTVKPAPRRRYQRKEPTPRRP